MDDDEDGNNGKGGGDGGAVAGGGAAVDGTENDVVAVIHQHLSQWKTDNSSARRPNPRLLLSTVDNLSLIHI